VSPVFVMAQEASEEAEQDTIEVVDDNSSAFNDSVQFDDMEPVFYEAADDDNATDEGPSIMFYVTMAIALWPYIGIAAVLIIVLIILRKVSKKKS